MKKTILNYIVVLVEGMTGPALIAMGVTSQSGNPLLFASSTLVCGSLVALGILLN